jgi:hypothetical protein
MESAGLAAYRAYVWLTATSPSQVVADLSDVELIEAEAWDSQSLAGRVAAIRDGLAREDNTVVVQKGELTPSELPKGTRIWYGADDGTVWAAWVLGRRLYALYEPARSATAEGVEELPSGDGTYVVVARVTPDIGDGTGGPPTGRANLHEAWTAGLSQLPVQTPPTMPVQSRAPDESDAQGVVGARRLERASESTSGPSAGLGPRVRPGLPPLEMAPSSTTATSGTQASPTSPDQRAAYDAYRWLISSTLEAAPDRPIVRLLADDMGRRPLDEQAAAVHDSLARALAHMSVEGPLTEAPTDRVPGMLIWFRASSGAAWSARIIDDVSFVLYDPTTGSTQTIHELPADEGRYVVARPATPGVVRREQLVGSIGTATAGAPPPLAMTPAKSSRSRAATMRSPAGTQNARMSNGDAGP